MRIAIYGKNVFLEALQTCPQALGQVFIEEKLRDEDIWRAVKEARIIPKVLSQKTADYLAPGALHQGGHG
jgi:tRNA G18 (ribose-2'-O)-methylase SpoU